MYFFSRWPEFIVSDILWYILKLWGRCANHKWMKCFIFFCFYTIIRKFCACHQFICLRGQKQIWTTLWEILLSFVLLRIYELYTKSRQKIGYHSLNMYLANQILSRDLLWSITKKNHSQFELPVFEMLVNKAFFNWSWAKRAIICG